MAASSAAATSFGTKEARFLGSEIFRLGSQFFRLGSQFFGALGRSVVMNDGEKNREVETSSMFYQRAIGRRQGRNDPVQQAQRLEGCVAMQTSQKQWEEVEERRGEERRGEERRGECKARQADRREQKRAEPTR